MMKKESKEWTIDVPWGKIAMISWGSSSAPPVLMVHGYMDSAATFSLLAEHLADEYYYVAFDLPGHGKSDPLPSGPLIGTVHMVEPMRYVVEHMEWNTFVYIAHSMGVLIGCIYNLVYPGRISRMVCLDPGPALNPYYEAHHKPDVCFKRYHTYYENIFGKSAPEDLKSYNYDKIVSSVSKIRKLTTQQAEVVLSRSLVALPGERYRLSWEPRAKPLTPLALSQDNLSYITLQNAPLMLVTISSMDHSNESAKKFVADIINGYHRLKNCLIINVDGHHDVHITSAAKIGAYINEFLKKECCVKSKI